MGAGLLGYDAKRFHDQKAYGKTVKLGIADSGIDVAHPTFSRLVAEKRLAAFAAFDSNGIKKVQTLGDGSIVSDSDATPSFTHYHGTFCSAILVGEDTDGKGLRGLAPRASLAVALVLQELNNGTTASILAGMSWLADQKCDIVTLSLGRPGKHDEWASATQSLVDQGTVVVCAIGNSHGVLGLPQSDSPANYPVEPTHDGQGLYLSVGAINQKDRVGDFSSGELVDWKNVEAAGSTAPSEFAGRPAFITPTMVAPGVSIISAVPQAPSGGYLQSSGTSFAAPHVAGLIALILDLLRARMPSATARDAATLMLQSLKPLQAGKAVDDSGKGKVDIDLLFQNIDRYFRMLAV